MFIKNQKGHDSVLWNGNKYTLNRTVKTTKYWRCSKRSCNARIYTTLRGKLLNGEKGLHHNHDNVSVSLEQVKSELRKRVGEEDVKVLQIYKEEAEKRPGNMPVEFSSVRSSMYRNQSKRKSGPKSNNKTPPSGEY